MPTYIYIFTLHRPPGVRAGPEFFGELGTVPFDPAPHLLDRVRTYLDDLDSRWQNDTITVVIPEFVVSKWYSNLLHNQSALALKLTLLFRPNTVVISVPYHLDAEPYPDADKTGDRGAPVEVEGTPDAPNE